MTWFVTVTATTAPCTARNARHKLHNSTPQKFRVLLLRQAHVKVRWAKVLEAAMIKQKEIKEAGCPRMPAKHADAKISHNLACGSCGPGWLVVIVEAFKKPAHDVGFAVCTETTKKLMCCRRSRNATPSLLFLVIDGNKRKHAHKPFVNTHTHTEESLSTT